MRRHPLEGAAVQREKRAILLAPGETRRNQREGRRRRQAEDFLSGDLFGERRANAKKEWIARSQHDGGRAASLEHLRDAEREGRRPGTLRRLRRTKKRQMPRATEDDCRPIDDRARGRGQGAVFANSDDREPAPGHGTRRDV